MCYTEDRFSVAAAPIIQKWEALWPESTFPQYVNEQFIDRKNAWYEGFDRAARAHSTNNALEAPNGTIKICHTLRERLPVGRFLEAPQGMVHWSAAGRGI